MAFSEYSKQTNSWMWHFKKFIQMLCKLVELYAWNPLCELKKYPSLWSINEDVLTEFYIENYYYVNVIVVCCWQRKFLVLGWKGFRLQKGIRKRRIRIFFSQSSPQATAQCSYYENLPTYFIYNLYIGRMHVFVYQHTQICRHALHCK